MKNINLMALSEFNFEEAGILLSWLENGRYSEMNLEQLKKSPPVRTSKVGPIVKVFEQFGLISKKQDRFSLTQAGKDFSRSGPTVRKAVMKHLFMQIEQIKRVLGLLANSPTGRIPRRLIHEVLSTGALSVVTETQIQSLISWAEACDLFGYDKKRDEIFGMDLENPRGPTEITRGNENSPALSKAS